MKENYCGGSGAVLFLHEYIENHDQTLLACHLKDTKNTYDIYSGGDPFTSLPTVVDRYNWLGLTETKATYEIYQNSSRNITGALFQDYVLHLLLRLTQEHEIDVFTEVKIPYGNFPFWSAGEPVTARLCEKTDIAVGRLLDEQGLGQSVTPSPYYRIPKKHTVMPLVTISCKILVSQKEFFEWIGRDTLMSKGNPHCLSILVALRKEMDSKFIDATQARSRFFLFGNGGEGKVLPDETEVNRFCATVKDHLRQRLDSSETSVGK